MYVEISPRQSGKSTRLVEAAVTYLRSYLDRTIALVSHDSRSSQNLKRDIRNRLALLICLEQGLEWPDDLTYRLIDSVYVNRIEIYRNTQISPSHREPDYWFIDEFAYLSLNDVFPYNHYSINQRPDNVILNAYYCTTPNGGSNESTNRLVDYCRNNDITINFHNPWTEQRLEEQSVLAPYMRDAVLGEWVNYMASHGFPIEGLKENWISKHIKKHKFNEY